MESRRRACFAAPTVMPMARAKSGTVPKRSMIGMNEDMPNGYAMYPIRSTPNVPSVWVRIAAMQADDSKAELSSAADRLAYARALAGYASPRSAARTFGWNENTYKSHENGIRQSAGLKEEHARKYARAFNVSLAWLMTGRGEPKGRDAQPELVRIIGRVGADAGGAVLLAFGDASYDMAPMPPGGTTKTVALEVNGSSMPMFADDGSLIYFDDQKVEPTPDLIGEICAVETEDGRVLVKRLQRGSEPGLWNLESIVGATIKDVRLRWAAEITGITPPRQARRIIIRAEDHAA